MFLRRLLLTIGTTAALCGVYLAYSQLMRPLIPDAPPPSQPLAAVVENEATRPVENVRVAETYLATQQPWTTEARYLLRSAQGAFLYTNDWQPEGKEGRIRLTPFAMAWVSINKDTGIEEAVTVVSESASLKFSGTFDLMSADAGRVIGAALEGRTRVTGPNGLMFDGRNFYFSESSSSLYSELPVTFTYAGNKGEASRFQADLIPQTGPPDRDRPHIFGVRTVRLSQNVKMDLQLKQKDDPIALKLRCAGHFEYDVPNQTAIYKDSVVASRETGPQQFDWIDCDKLTVLFGDPDQSTALEPPVSITGGSREYQKLNQTWKFRRLQAERFTPTTVTTSGKKVPSFQLHSMQYNLRASFRQLVYDAEQQLLVLRDDDNVKVVQTQKEMQTQMQAPEIMIQMAEGQKLNGVLCRGEGWINYRDSRTNTVVFAADWKQHLRHVANVAEGMDLIELANTASFRQPSENSALGAELIRVWTTPLTLAGNMLTDKSKPKPASEPGPKKTPTDVFRRLEATQDVVLVSPQLEGRCQKLEAALDTSVAPRISKPGSSPLGGLKSKPADDQERRTEKPDDFPMVAAADQIRLRLVPTTSGNPDVAEIWTDGQVALSQQHGDGRSALAIQGEHVHLQHNGGNEQIAEITGSPATVRENGMKLEAGVIHLDRADNRMSVDGKGLLELPVKSDLQGKPLPVAQPLTVTWKERMSFDGRTADFRGLAHANFGESRIDCNRMEVVLSERLSFTERPARSKNNADPQAQLAAVHCYDDVKFHDYTRDGANLVGEQQADVWEMHIDRVSGAMTAQGPGRMQMWQRGQGKRAQIAAPQSARANTPQQVDATEWEYTFVKFDGKMEGNLHQRHSTFRDRCEIIHGPVKHPRDVIARDKLPKAGGLLRCQELQVMQAAGVDEERGKIQLVGHGDADLEGYGFVAKADQIAYDESKKAYTLRGVGKNLARVWHQDAPGVPSRETALQWMEFIPATNTFRAIGITGADSGR